MLQIELSDPHVIRLSGWLDASQVPAAESTFEAISTSHVVDFEKLEYISSAGLGLLLSTQQRLSSSGHQIRLVNLSPHIKNVFVCAGFDTIFEIA